MASRYRFANGVDLVTGTGSPEGAVTANVGSLYLDDATGDLYTKTTGSGNTGWAAAGGGSGDVAGPASSVDGEIALFSGTTGKVIKSATGSGLVHATSGVYSTGRAALSDIVAATVTARILARKTAGSGDWEESTLSQVLDLVGSAADGDILYRTGGAWTRLAGSDGYLKNASNVLSWGDVAADLGITGIGVAHVQLSNTQIGSLLSTPIEVVAAPGSGKARVPIAVVTSTNVVVGYGSATTMNLRYAGDSNNISGGLVGITSTTGKHVSVATGTISAVLGTAVWGNVGIVVRAGANPTGGDASNTLDVWTLYLEFTVP